MTMIVHPTFLLQQPTLNAAALALLPDRMHVQVLSTRSGFLCVRCDDGRSGYVPAACCEPGAAVPFAVRLVQPVALYEQPVPGMHGTWMCFPHEALTALGRDERFLLVQRENGQIGYVPAVLCGEAVGTRPHIGPIDLEAVLLGGAWAMANIIGVVTIVSFQPWIDNTVRPYVLLTLLVVAIMLLWLAGQRRNLARSFAIGILLAYLFLHLMSGGSLTLWSVI